MPLRALGIVACVAAITGLAFLYVKTPEPGRLSAFAIDQRAIEMCRDIAEKSLRSEKITDMTTEKVRTVSDRHSSREVVLTVRVIDSEKQVGLRKFSCHTHDDGDWMTVVDFSVKDLPSLKRRPKSE